MSMMFNQCTRTRQSFVRSLDRRVVGVVLHLVEFGGDARRALYVDWQILPWRIIRQTRRAHVALGCFLRLSKRTRHMILIADLDRLVRPAGAFDLRARDLEELKCHHFGSDAKIASSTKPRMSA